MMKCRCGNSFDESQTQYYAIDILHGYERITFCSRDCRRSWVYGKIAGMAVSILIGIVFGIIMTLEIGIAGLFLIFVPYMLRKIIGSGGGAGEFLVFAGTLFGSITLVYPIYKIFQEIREYVHIFREDKNIPA